MESGNSNIEALQREMFALDDLYVEHSEEKKKYARLNMKYQGALHSLRKTREELVDAERLVYQYKTSSVTLDEYQAITVKLEASHIEYSILRDEYSNFVNSAQLRYQNCCKEYNDKIQALEGGKTQICQQERTRKGRPTNNSKLQQMYDELHGKFVNLKAQSDEWQAKSVNLELQNVGILNQHHSLLNKVNSLRRSLQERDDNLSCMQLESNSAEIQIKELEKEIECLKQRCQLETRRALHEQANELLSEECNVNKDVIEIQEENGYQVSPVSSDVDEDLYNEAKRESRSIAILLPFPPSPEPNRRSNIPQERDDKLSCMQLESNSAEIQIKELEKEIECLKQQYELKSRRALHVQANELLSKECNVNKDVVEIQEKNGNQVSPVSSDVDEDLYNEAKRESRSIAVLLPFSLSPEPNRRSNIVQYRDDKLSCMQLERNSAEIQIKEDGKETECLKQRCELKSRRALHEQANALLSKECNVNKDVVEIQEKNGNQVSPVSSDVDENLYNEARRESRSIGILLPFPLSPDTNSRSNIAQHNEDLLEVTPCDDSQQTQNDYVFSSPAPVIQPLLCVNIRPMHTQTDELKKYLTTSTQTRLRNVSLRVNRRSRKIVRVRNNLPRKRVNCGAINHMFNCKFCLSKFTRKVIAVNRNTYTIKQGGGTELLIEKKIVKGGEKAKENITTNSETVSFGTIKNSEEVDLIRETVEPRSFDFGYIRTDTDGENNGSIILDTRSIPANENALKNEPESTKRKSQRHVCCAKRKREIRKRKAQCRNYVNTLQSGDKFNTMSSLAEKQNQLNNNIMDENQQSMPLPPNVSDYKACIINDMFGCSSLSSSTPKSIKSCNRKRKVSWNSNTSHLNETVVEIHAAPKSFRSACESTTVNTKIQKISPENNKESIAVGNCDFIIPLCSEVTDIDPSNTAVNEKQVLLNSDQISEEQSETDSKKKHSGKIMKPPYKKWCSLGSLKRPTQINNTKSSLTAKQILNHQKAAEKFASSQVNRGRERKSFKRPLGRKRIVPLQSPASPEPPKTKDVEPIVPKIIPLERICESVVLAENTQPEMNRAVPNATDQAKLLLQQMLEFQEDKNIKTAVRSLFGHKPAFIAKLVLEQAITDQREELAKRKGIFEPVLTITQQALLRLMVGLDNLGDGQVCQTFLNQVDELLPKLTNPAHLWPVTRLYVAICRYSFDMWRVRKVLCISFTTMGDLAIPFMYIILRSWIEVMPTRESVLHESLFVKAIVQLVLLKRCAQPGYQYANLRELLKGYYKYSVEPLNSNELLLELFRNYIVDGNECLLVLSLALSKELSKEWVFEKIDTEIKSQLNPTENIEQGCTIVKLVGSMTRCHSETLDPCVIESNRQWLEKCCDTPFSDRIRDCAMSALKGLSKSVNN